MYSLQLFSNILVGSISMHVISDDTQSTPFTCFCPQQKKIFVENHSNFCHYPNNAFFFKFYAINPQHFKFFSIKTLNF